MSQISEDALGLGIKSLAPTTRSEERGSSLSSHRSRAPHGKVYDSLEVCLFLETRNKTPMKTMAMPTAMALVTPMTRALEGEGPASQNWAQLMIMPDPQGTLPSWPRGLFLAHAYPRKQRGAGPGWGAPPDRCNSVLPPGAQPATSKPGMFHPHWAAHPRVHSPGQPVAACSSAT